MRVTRKSEHRTVVVITLSPAEWDSLEPVIREALRQPKKRKRLIASIASLTPTTPAPYMPTPTPPPPPAPTPTPTAEDEDDMQILRELQGGRVRQLAVGPSKGEE